MTQPSVEDAFAPKNSTLDTTRVQAGGTLSSGIVVPKDYVPSAESSHALYQLATDAFEGPLDLLLFLIKRHQLDIFDIPMAFVCERYLDCLAVMEELNIDVAAEFLFMASELVHIKSKTLLPQEQEEGEQVDVDPRAALVARLLEYQTYKEAANQLNTLPMLGRDVFDRSAERLPQNPNEPKLKEVNVFALVNAFQAVLKRQKPEVRHRVALEQISMRQRMVALIDILVTQPSTLFLQVIENLTTRLDTVVTFLSILEMTRLKLLRLYESEEGLLYLHPRFTDAQTALSRISGIDEHQYAG